MDHFLEDRQAEAIAQDWGVSVGVLNDLFWDLETLDGNDGELYGYLVRFGEDNAADLLEKVGVDSADLTRAVSLNAFDVPDIDDDDGFYSLNEPFPDLFVDSGEYRDVESREVILPAEQREQLQSELLEKLETLESVLNQFQLELPGRAHIHPPELIDAPPLPPHQLQEVIQAVGSMQVEVRQVYPSVKTLQKNSSVLKAAANAIITWLGNKMDLAVDTGIKWGILIVGSSILYNPEVVHSALVSVIHSTEKLLLLLGWGG